MITAERTGGTLEAATWAFKGKSTDTKPTQEWQGTKILNSSSFFEMDTFKPFFYDETIEDWITKQEV